MWGNSKMRQNYLKSHFRDQSFFPVATFLFKVKVKFKKKKKVDFGMYLLLAKCFGFCYCSFCKVACPDRYIQMRNNNFNKELQLQLNLYCSIRTAKWQLVHPSNNEASWLIQEKYAAHKMIGKIWRLRIYFLFFYTEYDLGSL